MTKTEVKALFGGSEAAVGKKLCRSQPAINQWPENDLSVDSRLLIVGAATVFKIAIPKEWLKKLRDDIESAA